LATQENKKGSCIGGASRWACQKTRSCTRGMYQKSNFPLPKKREAIDPVRQIADLSTQRRV